MNNNHKPILTSIESPESKRLRVLVDMKKAAESVKADLITNRLMRAEIRLRTTNGEEGSWTYGYFASALEELGIEIEYVSAYPLGPARGADGTVLVDSSHVPVLFREVCLFLRYDAPKTIA